MQQIIMKIKLLYLTLHISFNKFFHSKTVILHVPTIFFLITVLSVPIRLIICQICPLCQNLYKVHAQIQNRKMRVVRKWVGGGNFKRNMKMVGWQFLLKFSLHYSPSSIFKKPSNLCKLCNKQYSTCKSHFSLKNTILVLL